MILMDRETALTEIRRHQAELRRLGVVSLSLFGSMARGEAGSDSDIDVAVRAPPHEDEGGFAYLRRLDRIRAYLSEVLATPVDVIAEPTSRPRLQQHIDRDRRIAF
jgi:predicted nucleotidyltransferase